MIHASNFILIGSSGRNSGKTEFACRLISQHAHEFPVYAVKVKRVCLDKDQCDQKCSDCRIGDVPPEGFEISEESCSLNNKDTSRMLAAGAHKVFFLKSTSENLQQGFEKLMNQIPENVPVICESNGLRHIFEPGLYIVIQNNDSDSIKESYSSTLHHANRIIGFSNMNWDFDPKRIYFKENSWFVREHATGIILAGGKSSRMLGEDKSLLPVNGKPLISHIVDQLLPHFDELIIGANDVDKYSFLGLKVVEDIEKGKGPLMGIVSCLSESSNDINFITACDIPLMNIKLINTMIGMISGADVVIPVNDIDKFEPLYAVYRKSVIPFARKVLDHEKGKITQLLPFVKYKTIKFDHMEWYQNLNVKEDYLQFIEKVKKNGECY